MDLLEIAFLVFGGIGAAGVILHFTGYIPRPYRERLDNTPEQFRAVMHGEFQAAADALRAGIEALPIQMESAVETALNRVAEAQRKELEKEVTEGQVNSQLLNAAKNFKFNQREVDGAIAEAILGPALPILRQFAPGLANMLEENPQLVDVVINNPLFRKYVQPRIEQFLGSKSESSSGSNPFLRELRE